MQNRGITIVGLGPGPGELLTRQAWQALSTAACIYLRTARHPAVADLPPDVPQVSFDAIYERAAEFGEVYRQIAADVVARAAHEAVVYAVPGHPSVGEASVSHIQATARAANIPVTIMAGLSFIEPTLSALQVDGLDGLQLFDAIEIADYWQPPLNPDVPALLGQVYSQLLASNLKLALNALFPDEHQVALVHAAGTAEAQVEWLPLYAIDRSPHIGHLTSLYVPPLPEASSLPALAETVAVLRSPQGCPWDQEQTAQSLRPDFVEEMAEVLEALDTGNSDLLREELGDLLFHIVIQTQIASENGDFTLRQVIAGIEAKLKRRHPHIWGDWQASDSSEVVRNWAALKAAEKEKRGDQPTSILDNIPHTLPALAQSQKIQGRVRKIGFDWPDIDGVFAKLDEERDELKRATSSQEQQAELGDLLFVAANLANWMKLDGETALREASLRFDRRFRQLEALAASQEIDLAQADFDTLNQLWEEAKANLAAAHEATEEQA